MRQVYSTNLFSRPYFLAAISGRFTQTNYKKALKNDQNSMARLIPVIISGLPLNIEH
jgi:hypothetical protein